MAHEGVQEYCQRFRVHLALKVALGAVLCAFLCNVFHLSMGYLSSLIVVLVLVMFHGQTLWAGVPAILGILVAGTVQVWITMLLGDSRVAYGSCSLLWLFLWMAYLPALPLAHMLGGILIAMILFNFALGTAEIQTLVQGFWLQCFLGILTAISLDRLVWPSRGEDAYFETLARLLESFANDIMTIVDERDGNFRDRTAHATEIRHIAHLASLSSGALPGDDGARIRLNLTCRLIWERIRLAIRFIAGSRRGILTPDQRLEFHPIFEGLERHYRTVAEAAIHRLPAPGVDSGTQKAIHLLTERLRRRGGHATSMSGTAPVVRLLEHGLSDHERVVAAYNEILASLSRKQNRSANLGSIFAQILAWPQPLRIRVAAKIALIVLILLFAVTFLRFPGSSLVAFYGVAFGLSANIGQLYMKGRSGTIGVLGGIAMGILGVLVVTQSPHFPVLLGLFAIAIFVAAYASTAGEPFGFAGLQAALVTPYMFIYFEGPRWTVEDAATRACALVVSAATAMLVQRLVWPVDPLVLFRKVISEALEKIAAAWERLCRNERLMPKRSAVAFTFDQSGDLLKDSRYVIGSRHPLVHSYLKLLRSLQDIFAGMQATAQLLALEKDDEALTEAFGRIAPSLSTVTMTLRIISRHVMQQGSSGLAELPARLADVRAAAGRMQKEAMGGGDRRNVGVLGSLLCEIADSVANAVAAANEISASTPVPTTGSSEGWRSSARATPAR